MNNEDKSLVKRFAIDEFVSYPPPLRPPPKGFAPGQTHAAILLASRVQTVRRGPLEANCCRPPIAVLSIYPYPYVDGDPELSLQLAQQPRSVPRYQQTTQKCSQGFSQRRPLVHSCSR